VKDLRQHLKDLEKTNEIWYSDEALDPRYEVTALWEEAKAKGKDVALYFNKVKGSEYPLVANVYGGRERLAKALGVPIEQAAQYYQDRQANPINPVFTQEAPAQEIVFEKNDVDLLQFPVITGHEADVAPYITSGLSIARDPVTGQRNVSFNRLQVVNKNTAYIHLGTGRHLTYFFKRAEELGQPLPVTFSLGTPPAFALGALGLGPVGLDETGIMGSLAGEPVRLVKAKTVDCVGLADAEIILEGEILPGIREEEGPFCEFTGYATGVRKREVVRFKGITCRRNPIYQALIAGSAEHCILGAIPREGQLLKTAKQIAPRLKAIHMTPAGCGRFTCYLALEKTTEAQPWNVGMSILGADVFTKNIVILDDDINIFNEEEVQWAIATRCQPARDYLIIPKAMGTDLDPSAEVEHVGSKVIIDATAKPNLKSYHIRASVPAEIRAKATLERFFKGI